MSGFLTLAGADYLLGMFGSEESAVDRYYVALITGNRPGITSDGQDIEEPGDDSYARAEFENTSGAWSVKDGVLTAEIAVSFPVAVSDWGEVKYWAICDSYENGRVFWVGEFANPFFVGADDQVVVQPGGMVLTIQMYGWGS